MAPGGHAAKRAKLPRGITAYHDSYRVRVPFEGEQTFVGFFHTWAPWSIEGWDSVRSRTNRMWPCSSTTTYCSPTS